MPIVKSRRILVISLCLSAGASALAHARSWPERSVSLRAGATVRERAADPGFLEAAQHLWGGILGFPWGPPPPPPPGGDGPTRREGPGVCPHGHL
jgi:hypothetical protein